MLESEISKSIAARLDLWEMTGNVVWWLRINSGKVKTAYGSYVQLAPRGTPDFVSVLRNKKGKLDLLFIEVKRPGIKLKLRPEQIKFKEKYNTIQDVHFLVVDHSDYLDFYIDNNSYNFVEDMKL